jgi:SAM-dependent methyltransferase
VTLPPPGQVSAASVRMSQAGCPLCGSRNGHQSVEALISVSGEQFSRLHCTGCGCEWLAPAPSEAALARAYGTDYYGGGESKFVGPVESVIRWFRDGRARSAQQFLGDLPSRVLDIGCGNGGFLASLGRLGPHELHGFELPGSAAERARSVPGLHLHVGAFSAQEFSPGSIRLITLFHVIEHLPDPGSFLDSAALLLQPGGRLRISLPNLQSWQAALSGQGWLHWDPPRHLWLAPPAAIRDRAARAGLRLVRSGHFSLEQNPFGLLQGLLNRCFPRDRLYNWLKRRAPETGKRVSLPWPDLLLAALLGPACLFLSLLESACGRGGTVELDFEKAGHGDLPRTAGS